MAKTQNITTDTALVNIVNTQRYAILACLDDVVSLARNDELNWYFEDLDDLLNTNIDRVVEVVCACSAKFDGSMIERFRNNVRFGSLITSYAINTNDSRVRSEARKLIEVNNILSRIVVDLVLHIEKVKSLVAN